MTSPRRPPRLVVLLVVAVLATAGLVTGVLVTDPFASPPAAAGRVYGIAPPGIVDEPPAQEARDLANIAAVGFSWVRTDFAWVRVQKTPGGIYHWDRLDRFVRLAGRYHLHVLAILDYAPPWAAVAGCVGPHCAPADVSGFVDYAARVAAHFGTSVGAWEIWNEENSVTAWGVPPDPAVFATLLTRTSSAIRAKIPQANVIMGGLGNGSVVTGMPAVAFLRGVYAAGAAGSFDAVAYHPYTTHDPPGDSLAWAQIGRLHEVMQANGDGALPIWLTEFGAATQGSSPYLVSTADQATLAHGAFTAVSRLPYVGALFWFGYQDTAPTPDSTGQYFGIRRTDGTEKPAYHVLYQLLKGLPSPP